MKMNNLLGVNTLREKSLTQIFSLALLLSPSLPCKAAPANVNPIAGVSDAIISEKNREAIEEKALSGSVEAAHKLYAFYSSVKLDSEKGGYRAQIEAENGSTHGQYAYGFYLHNSADTKARLRARYWLRLAEKNGEPLATAVLKEMDEK